MKVLVQSPAGIWQIIHFIASECVAKLVYVLPSMFEGKRELFLAVIIKCDKFVLPVYSSQ
jgi:hypothetical protein